MNFEMKNWRKVKLSEILTESKIVSESPNSDQRIRVKLNLGGIEKRPLTNDIEGATKYYIRKSGQFIFGKQNLHKGAFGIVPPELDGFESTSDIPAFDIDSRCYPEWLYYFFINDKLYFRLSALTKGVGSKRINLKDLLKLEIPLPEKKQQKIILKEIESFEIKREKIIKEIDFQAHLVSRLKKNYIEDALEGRLTEKWRTINTTESVQQIIQEVEKEKNNLIEQKKLRKEKQLNQITTEEHFFSIPQSWIWCRLDDVMSVTGGVTKGKKYKENLISVPYLRVANVQRNYLDLSEVKDIIISKIDYDKYQLLKDDLLMAEGGDADKVGRCAMWNNEIEGCIHQNHVFRIRSYNDLVNSSYMLNFLNSPFAMRYYEASSKQTTNLASINKTTVRLTPIALPPLSEQIEIKNKITSFTNSLSKIVIEIEDNRLTSENLLFNHLNKVFGSTSFIFDNFKDVPTIDYLDRLKLKNTNIIKNLNTTMELEEILKDNGNLPAVKLWKMSKFENDIDAFYDNLKLKIEVEKTIVETEEKGILALIK
jgi:restriction endonuclease S subunit